MYKQKAMMRGEEAVCSSVFRAALVDTCIVARNGKNRPCISLDGRKVEKNYTNT